MMALAAAAWLLMAFFVNAAEVSAMMCPEAAAPAVATTPVPPCHGHAPAAPADEPAKESKPCSPFCELLCHGIALLGPPALAVPLVAVPQLVVDGPSRNLPLLPDTIDHVPLA